MVEEKYSGYLDNLLARNVLKNSEIIKSFLYFLGYSKEEVNHKDTNKLHWEKAKKYLSK